MKNLLLCGLVATTFAAYGDMAQPSGHDFTLNIRDVSLDDSDDAYDVIIKSDTRSVTVTVTNTSTKAKETARFLFAPIGLESASPRRNNKAILALLMASTDDAFANSVRSAKLNSALLSSFRRAMTTADIQKMRNMYQSLEKDALKKMAAAY